MCFLFLKESKADESGEGDNQSSYLMLTSAAGLNVIRHLQENSLCELSLQYLVEVSVSSLESVVFAEYILLIPLLNLECNWEFRFSDSIYLKCTII